MRGFLKWTGIIVGGLIVLLIFAVLFVYINSNARINATYTFRPAAVAIPSDSVALANGAHIAVIRGCADCHGENLGGRLFLDEPIATLYATNLTRGKGGVGGSYSDSDWVRAIRHGIGPHDRPLLFMPSYEYYPLSDEDLGALIAHIKNQPSVDNTLPSSSVTLMGRALLLAGQLPLLSVEIIDHDGPRPDAPESAGPTPEYGQYLAVSCTGCHGETFSGGPIPGVPPSWPPAANLTKDQATGIGNWGAEDFSRALREGKRPDGSEIDDAYMPWERVTSHMTDDEIRAVWLYLQSLPPKTLGNR